MTDNHLERIEAVIRAVFDEYEGPVMEQLTADDVEQWDSHGHVQFIVMVEQEFGVRFDMSEIGELKNIGEVADLIRTKP